MNPASDGKASGRVLLLLMIVPLLLVTPSSAANHFVRAGATGTGAGTDWTNALTDLPSSLTRGDVYYVAAGTYKQHLFNDPDSGSSVIEIRAATAADHGTDTGWQSSFQGEALFRPTSSPTPGGCVFEFQTDFYRINGNGLRGSDWQSGYLIRISDSNSVAHECVILIGQGSGGVVGGGIAAHDITLDYVNADGSHTVLDSGVHEQGIESRCGGSNLALRHSYVHDDGAVLLFIKGKHDSLLSAPSSLCAANSTGGQWTAEFNYLARNYSSAVFHGEGMECDEGQYCVIRFNYFRDMNGTAFIASPSGCGATTCNIDNQWDIYGNVFFLKNAFQNNNVACGVAGVIQAFDAVFSGPLRFVNNTIANANTSICPNNESGGMILIQQGAQPAKLNAGLIVQNNLWYNNDSFAPVNLCASCSSVTWDHNAYFSQPLLTGDTDPNAQVAGTNPFVSVSAGNYHLSADTANGASLPAPYNVDIDGTMRGTDGIWDRGAFQFGAPAPPPQLTATVNLVWAASPSAAANPGLTYNVYRSSPNCSQLVKIGSTAAGVLTFSDPTAVVGVTYCYAVTAVLNGLESTDSPTATVTVTAPPPTGLTATLSGSSVVLAWTGSSAASFNIYRGTGPCASNPTLLRISSVPVGILTFTDTSVVVGNSYCYAVTSVINSVEGKQSTTVGVSLAPAPPPSLVVTTS